MPKVFYVQAFDTELLCYFTTSAKPTTSAQDEVLKSFHPSAGCPHTNLPMCNGRYLVTFKTQCRSMVSLNKSLFRLHNKQK